MYGSVETEVWREEILVCHQCSVATTFGTAEVMGKNGGQK